MKTFNAKLLLSGSIFIPLYFFLLYVVDIYKINFLLIGVFRELVTIPALLGIVVFWIFDLFFLFQKNKNSEKILVFIGFCILSICTFEIVKNF